jgi:hypothetical protein
MQGKGAPLPLHSIPKTNNNTNKNKTKTNRKIKVVYTEDLTEPRENLFVHWELGMTGVFA